MKKFLTTFLVLITIVSSTFAFGLSVGAKGNFGGKMDLIQESGKNIANGDISMKAIDKLSYGGGAYVYADLFGGIGAQAEANFVTNKLGINYLDIPLMGMLTLNFFDRVTVGIGGGVNFSKVIGTDIKGDLIDAAKDVGNVFDWTKGIILASDIKIFFSKHIGLLIGARGIFEGEPNELLNEAIKNRVTKDDPMNLLVGSNRKEFYANLGLEFKIF